MVLYVVRHGQTDYNADMRFQGRMDIPLNALGESQAKGNGQKLKDLIGDQAADFEFVSSPLGRTRQTMEFIRSEMGLRPKNYQLDDLLIEISFGDWEGFTAKELERKFPDLFAARERDKWNFSPPGNPTENYAQVSERISAFLRSVKKPTVCVCHGGVIRTMFHQIDKLDTAKAAIGPIPQDKILKIEHNKIGWL